MTRLLLESGSQLLLENGNALELEATVPAYDAYTVLMLHMDWVDRLSVMADVLHRVMLQKLSVPAPIL